MKQASEYKFLVDYFHHPKGKTHCFDFNDEKEQIEFNEIINEKIGLMVLYLDNETEVNWRINSHSITFAGEVCILSILLETCPI